MRFINGTVIIEYLALDGCWVYGNVQQRLLMAYPAPHVVIDAVMLYLARVHDQMAPHSTTLFSASIPSLDIIMGSTLFSCPPPERPTTVCSDCDAIVLCEDTYQSVRDQRCICEGCFTAAHTAGRARERKGQHECATTNPDS